MLEEEIGLALIRQNADLFYFTGTIQDGHLVIPHTGSPCFFVWRSYKRALEESPLARLGWVQPLNGLSHFVQLVKEAGLDSQKVVGLEFDVLPAGFFRFYSQKVWPDARFKDISPLIRRIRSIKDESEIESIKAACQQAYHAIKRVPSFLEKAETELELAAMVEAELRKRGHCGLMRMRIWNQEMGMDQVVSGPNATFPSWTNTPVGGLGPHPAFGMGASSKKIGRDVLVSVDLGGWYNGYMCDTTRPFFIGSPPAEVLDVFKVVKKLMGQLEKMLTPGTKAGSVYDHALSVMEMSGYADSFMGLGAERVSFVGHGLGIELDEYPFISKGNDMVLKKGMVVALEPKIILPDYGVVGLEDTYVIGEKGATRLTLGEQELKVIKKP